MGDDFFGPPPEPPPEPPRRVEQPWFGPPSGTLPGVVALELVLARSAIAAVCVTRVSAYPTGFEFDVLTVSDASAEGDLEPYMFGPGRRRMPSEGTDPRLRLGVQFSDGAKAINVGAGPGFGGHGEEPEGPVLRGQGGGGGGGRWRQSYWVWPLPPSGPLAFVCEWSAASIPVTRHEIDAQLLLDAAERAQQIFEAGPRSEGGGNWTSFAVGETRGSRPNEPKPGES